MKKVKIFGAALLLMAGLMSACGKENNSDDDISTYPELIVGKWLVESITENGIDLNNNDIDYDDYPCIEWYFNDDGTFVEVVNDITFGASYKIVKDTLTMYEEYGGIIVEHRNLVIVSFTKKEIILRSLIIKDEEVYNEDKIIKLRRDSKGSMQSCFVVDR